MSLLVDTKHNVLFITIDNPEKHNALDEFLIQDMQNIIAKACLQSNLRAIILRSNGKNFSSGADFSWMQRMAVADQEKNLSDAKQLADLLYTLYQAPIPTIAMVQGAAIGGGAGLVAACDIAICSNDSQFGFPEVKWGLIPAVISPYVMRAIGTRATHELFFTGERINAKRALALNLVHHCVSSQDLTAFTQQYIQQLVNSAPNAMRATKALLRRLELPLIDENIQLDTAMSIAKQRMSAEGKKGIAAFLSKITPNWAI